jgi:transcriptional regulator
MYDLPHFKEKDPAEVIQFMQQHPFALVIAAGDEYPVSTQVPLLIEKQEEQIVLRGHIMRQSDHYKAFTKNNKVLCVFTGPHAYVSASWYSNPQNASTWNYMTVHAKGELQFLNESMLLKILEETTRKFENDPVSPASYHHLPTDYISRLSKAIVGFEIKVQEVSHVFKLSQNRDKNDYGNIIFQLKNGDADAMLIAAEMEKRRDQLFSH